jgi:uncharacterized protein (TIGR02118 family)
MVKLVALLRRRPDLSHEEFLRHWRERHTPLLLGLPEFMRHLRRYVHGYPAGPFAADATGAEPFDGAAEMFFDSVEDMGRAFALPCYRERIRPDEERFLDLPRCAALVVTEAEMHDARGRS